jgi:hypothetical protein
MSAARFIYRLNPTRKEVSSHNWGFGVSEERVEKGSHNGRLMDSVMVGTVPQSLPQFFSFMSCFFILSPEVKMPSKGVQVQYK